MRVMEPLALKILVDGEKHPIQADFIYDPAFAIAFIGGRRSGKTKGGTIKAAIKLFDCLKQRQENPNLPKPNLLVIAPHYYNLFKGPFAAYEETFRQYGVLAPEKGIGTIVRSVSADSPRIELGANMGILNFHTAENPDLLRGGDYVCIHVDEGRDIDEEAFNIVIPSLTQPYRNPQIWVTTTPCGYDHWTYKRFNSEVAGFNLYRCSLDDNGYLTDSQKQLVKKGFEGLSEEWIAQEISGEFVILTGQCRFNTRILRRMMEEKEIIEPIWTDGLVEIYREPIVGRSYIAGGDSAEGLPGRDRSCIQIFDAQKGEQVCVIHGQITPSELARLATQYCRKYNNALLNIPSGPSGADATTLAKLKELNYTNICKSWKETSLWKGMAEAELAEAILNGELVFYRRNTIQELLSYCRKPNGEHQAAKGCYDDEVSGLLTMWQARKEPQVYAVASTWKSYDYVKWRK